MERRVLRKTAVEVCTACPNAGQEGCVKDKISKSTDQTVTIPLCIEERRKIHIGQKNIFDYCQKPPVIKPAGTFASPVQKKQAPKPEWNGHFELESDPLPTNPTEIDKPRLDTVEVTDAPFKRWDDGYTKLLQCIKDKFTITAMVKRLGIPRSTVRDRLTKLERKEIITPTKSVILGVTHTTFIITSGWALNLINNNEPEIIVNKPFKPEPIKFTRHHVTLQAEILGGIIPKGDRSYQPNGWVGEIFEGDGTYKIRVIPNKKTGRGRAAIDINICLGATSPADLTMRYHTFAEKYLGVWAERHHLKLGQITEYRTPHTAIEGSNGLAQTIMGVVGGEVKLADVGVQIDESDEEHKGEVEFHGKKGEKTLRNFDFALNQSPEKMERLESKFDSLRNTLHEQVGKVGEGISGIQGWLVLQRENDLLREQNQLLREQITEMRNEVKELKSMMGLSSLPPETKRGKYDGMGIYQ